MASISTPVATAGFQLRPMNCTKFPTALPPKATIGGTSMNPQATLPIQPMIATTATAAHVTIMDWRTRLCWVEWKPTDAAKPLLWPAVYYIDTSELLSQATNDDMIGSLQKTELALRLYHEFGSTEDSLPTMVARLLGVQDTGSTPEEPRVALVELTPNSFFGEFSTWCGRAMNELSHPQAYAPHHHLDLYLSYMKGIDAAFDLLPTKSGQPPRNKMQVLGQKRLEQFLHAPAAAAAAAAAAASEPIAALADTTTTSPQASVEDEGSLMTSASSETATHGNHSKQVKASAQQKVANKAATPMPLRRDSTVTPTATAIATADSPYSEEDDDETNVSSSATVVSTDEMSPAAATSPCKKKTKASTRSAEIPAYATPLLDGVDELIRAKGALYCVEWDMKVIDKKTWYFPPGVSFATGVAGKNFFDEDQLVEYLKAKYKWKGPSSEGATASAQEVEPESMVDLVQPLLPKGNAGKKKTTTKDDTKKTEVITTPPMVTPNRTRSGRTTRPASDSDPLMNLTSTVTKSSLAKDDFYVWGPLFYGLLEAHLGWENGIKPKNGLDMYVYEVPGTKGQNGGEYLVDYFHHEQEVIDFCRALKYKETYGHLLGVAREGLKRKERSAEPIDGSRSKRIKSQ